MNTHAAQLVCCARLVRSMWASVHAQARRMGAAARRAGLLEAPDREFRRRHPARVWRFERIGWAWGRLGELTTLKKRALRTVVFACLSFGSNAYAYIEPPYITPVSPQAGQTVYVNIGAGVCDAILEEPGYPQVARIGNAVRVLLLAVRYDNIELCNLPPGIAVLPFGDFEAGSYEVTIDISYFDSHGNPQVETIGVAPMEVVGATGASPIPAPTASPLALIILALGLILIARARRA